MFWCETWSPYCRDVPLPPLRGINPQGEEPRQPRGFSSESLTGGTSKTTPPLHRYFPIQQCQLITRRAELWWTDDMPCINYSGLAWAASQRYATDRCPSEAVAEASPPETPARAGVPPLMVTPMLPPWDGTELPASVFTWLVNPLSCFVLYKHIHIYTYVYICVHIYNMYMHVCMYICLVAGERERELFEIPGFLTDSEPPWWPLQHYLVFFQEWKLCFLTHIHFVHTHIVFHLCEQKCRNNLLWVSVTSS